MSIQTTKNRKKTRTRAKIRRIIGRSFRPRLSVFRSNRYLYAQIIDDRAGKTLVSVKEREVEETEKADTKAQRAEKTGQLLAKKAVAQKITQVVFDRSGYQFHGRVKALAEGARKGGLSF